MVPVKQKIRSVWVPFECTPLGGATKCDNLPRFLKPEEIRWYLQTRGHLIRNRLIEWREHYEAEFIEEYLKGVGRAINDRPH